MRKPNLQDRNFLLGKSYFLIVEISVMVHLEICVSVMESNFLLNEEHHVNRLQDNKEGQTHRMIIFVFLQWCAVPLQ